MNKDRIAELSFRVLHNLATPEELEELNDWYNSFSDEEEEVVFLGNAEDNLAVRNRLLKNIQDKIYQRSQNETPVRKMNTGWIRYAVAASVVFIIGISVFYFQHNNSKLTATQVQTVKVEPGANVSTNENTEQTKEVVAKVKPATEGAVLTLSNGKQVNLRAENDLLVIQDIKRIEKKNGFLVYKDNVNASDNLTQLYNTIATPAKMHYKVVLPDGTRAWLNAGSSIHFPLEFSEKERVVDITGEVYFEVVHNEKTPLRVRLQDGTEIIDVGTAFNVKAYSNEKVIKTTLIEGSVRIERQGRELASVTEGQEFSMLRANINDFKVKEVNTLSAIAWKSGIFEFNGADIESIMREISRWYGVEVEFRGTVTDQKFVGKIVRDVELSKVMSVLKTSGLHFTYEENKIIITP